MTPNTKLKYWKVTRRQQDQSQFPGEYTTKHGFLWDTTEDQVRVWASKYFSESEIIKIEAL